MNSITIIEVQGQLVIDSRIIAEQLGIKHKNFLGTVRGHQAVIEEHFGVLAFETDTTSITALGGRPETFCWLTESQSNFLMTLSRNTPEVIRCKAGIVKAFQEQKRQLENPVDRSLLNDLASRIAKLEIQPKSALPKANVDPIPQPVAPLTERAMCNMLVRSYTHNQTTTQPLTEQEIWRWVYNQLKYRYHYDAYARVKKSGLKSKLDQIAADGKMSDLLATCNYLLN